MNFPFILFDLRSGNVMEGFASEGDAWNALHDMAEDHGLEALGDLSLLRMLDGQPTLIAMEDDLVRWVTRELSSKAVASESRR